MFRPDINSIRDFYKSPLGGLACRRIRARIHNLWPEVGSGAKLAEPEYIAAIGYAPPYLTPLFRAEEDGDSSYRIFCLMPAEQGARSWPKEKKNRVLVSYEKQIPLPDESLDRVLLIHSLEFTDDVREFMRELWRVLKPGGKVVVVVPSRRGFWSNAEHTPFGYGKPYSISQIKDLFIDTLFLPLHVESALFIPPIKRHFFLKISTLFEPIFSKLSGPFGGILIAEAEKQLYAPNVEPARGKRKFAAAVDGAD